MLYLLCASFYVVLVALIITRAPQLRPAGAPWASASIPLDEHGASAEPTQTAGSSPAQGRAILREILGRPATRRMIRTWLSRMLIPEQSIDDVAHSVIKAALESADSFDPARGPAERWLYGITANLAARHRAAQARRARRETDVPLELEDETQSAEELLVAEATRSEVREAVLTLAPSEQSIVAGHDLDDVCMAACAEAAGIPLSTAYKHRAKGLLRLRDVLVAFGAAPNAPSPSAVPGRRDDRRR